MINDFWHNVNNKDSDQPAHLCRLIIACAICTHHGLTLRNLEETANCLTRRLNAFRLVLHFAHRTHKVDTAADGENGNLRTDVIRQLCSVIRPMML